MRLVGVADPLEANRNQAAADYGTAAYADYRELVGKIDAAVVAVPTKHHHAVGLDLLRQGIHLLIEKPLATSVAEADDLVRTARRAGVVLQVGHVERFNPAWSRVQPHVRDPKFIESTRFSGFSGRSTDIGVVLDVMIHDLDLVLSLVRSPIAHVDALGVSVLGGHEDAVNARMTFENGCVASINASRVSYQMTRTMQIWSHAGFASVDFATRSATLVRPSEAIAKREFDLNSLPAAERAQIKDRLFTEHLLVDKLQADASDQITAELLDFADSIRTGRAPRVGGEQGRDALAAAEQVLAAVAEHRWDGHAAGRRGPHVLPTPSVIPAPHFLRVPAAASAERREAG
jgi:predicted dehydrogenase